MVGERVRTVTVRVPVSNMDRTGTVTAVAVRDGVFEVQIEDDKLAKSYCTESDFVKCSDDVGTVAPRSYSVIYTKLNLGSSCFEHLPVELHPVVHGHNLEASAVSCGIAELKWRCPVDYSRVFDPIEAASVIALCIEVPSEQCALAQLRSDSEGVTKIWAVLH